MERLFDVVIIGGGINGCGCAADAAMRGLSVLLCEQDDLASKTSSSSSKLIHGGLRYLEQFDFSLVKKALGERQMLLRLAPHLVYPLPFILPHYNTSRPLWFLRTGLFIYDHLNNKNTLPKSQYIHRKRDPAYFDILLEDVKQGFLFYDCATDDARLTIANAIQAKQHGAHILTRTKLIKSQPHRNYWCLTFQRQNGEVFEVKTKSVINAAGPWIDSVNQILHIESKHALTLVKGSHIIVPKLYEGTHAYALQHQDHRVVFVIPYHDFTMIGTTETIISGSLEEVQIDIGEISYLLALVRQYFKKDLLEEHIIHHWSGARPLLTQAGKKLSTLSRDYSYHLTHSPAPAVVIYGGKITTYRQLAVEAINLLGTIFPDLPHSYTHTLALPGANLGQMNLEKYQQFANTKYHWLEEKTRRRYLSHYGTRMELILSGCNHMRDLGIEFTDTLYQVEVDYLVREEWAISCEDILWRRTKLGLTQRRASHRLLAEYLNQHESKPTCPIL